MKGGRSTSIWLVRRSVIRPRRTIHRCTSPWRGGRIEIPVNELNCGSSFPHRRCDPLNGTASDIAGREDARHAGLELDWRAIECPTGRARRKIGPRQNEALLVALHSVLQIARVRSPSNEDEERLREHFGAEYEDYCRDVKRWVPFVL